MSVPQNLGWYNKARVTGSLGGVCGGVPTQSKGSVPFLEMNGIIPSNICMTNNQQCHLTYLLLIKGSYLLRGKSA